LSISLRTLSSHEGRGGQVFGDRARLNPSWWGKGGVESRRHIHQRRCFRHGFSQRSADQQGAQRLGVLCRQRRVPNRVRQMIEQRYAGCGIGRIAEVADDQNRPLLQLLPFVAAQATAADIQIRQMAVKLPANLL